MDRWIDIYLIFAFCNFAKAPKEREKNKLFNTKNGMCLQVSSQSELYYVQINGHDSV